MTLPQLPTQPVELAVWWANQGWLVFPCREDKAPITPNGFKNGMTDEAAIRTTWAKHPKALVGGATGNYRSVVDLDVKTISGIAVWGLLGEVDAPPVWTSTTPSGGVHRVYNRIESHPSIGQYPYFGFDIRNAGGYIILPGSTLENGRRWELQSWDPDSRLASVIDWMKIERTLKEENPVTKALWEYHLKQKEEAKRVRDEQNRARRVLLAASTSPVRAGRLVAPLPPDAGGRRAESPEAWARVLELVAELRDVPDGLGHREISRICFEAGSRIVRHGQADVDQVIEAFQSGIGWIYRNDGDERKVFNDIDRCVRDGVARGTGEPWRSGMAKTVALTPPPANLPARPGMDAPPAQPTVSVGLSGGELEKAPILLPSEFFDGCPELEIIRQAAYNRYVSPTALAMTVLTRIASMTDHKLRLPALVGSHVGLSFYSILTAAVGGGKSSTVNLATELLGQDPTSTRQVEVITGNGTGEGLIQKHMEMVKEEGERHPKPQQTINNVFWYIDEGMNLVKEFERRGSQAAGILCSGWFCAGVGQNNATGELQRSLRPLSYNWGILIAIQDDNAHNLLAQQGIGLTQRCFWVSGNDPTIPDPDHKPEWPGALDWRHPAMPGDIPGELRGRLSAPAVDEGAPRHIKLPDWYRKEMEWGLWEQKAKGKVDELSEHIRLMEIKLSVLVGMLRGHLDPDDDDIRRARLAIGAHRKQIRRAANRTRLMDAQDDLIRAQKATERAEVRADELVRRFREKVENAVRDGKTTTWRAITQFVRGPVRNEMGGTDALADILSDMMNDGIIRQLGGEGGGTVYGCGRPVDAVVDASHPL